MRVIYRRLRKLEEGLGLLPETEDDRRLRERLAAARARMAASGYPVPDRDEGDLSGYDGS